MFTDRNNNKIPDCVERTAIIVAASTMLLTGCGTTAAASDTVTESCIGTLEECDAEEMMKKIEVDKAGLLTRHANFANYYYLVDTGIVYFIGFNEISPKAITPVISTNGNNIRYNEETQSCEEVGVDRSYSSQSGGTLKECEKSEMLGEIEVDKAGLLTKHTNFANYFYLVDTGIVYFIGFDSLNPKAITPVISTNGKYIRYNEETQSCEEVINSNDKSEVARNFEDTNSDEKSLLNKVSAF